MDTHVGVTFASPVYRKETANICFYMGYHGEFGLHHICVLNIYIVSDITYNEEDETNLIPKHHRHEELILTKSFLL